MLLENKIIAKGERNWLGGGVIDMEVILYGLMEGLMEMRETSEKEASKETENEAEEKNGDCGINMYDL